MCTPVPIGRFLCGAMLLLLAGAAQADVTISEFLADNRTGLADEDGQFSDWIELHNTDTANAVALNGWWLTDDPSDPHKWALPSVSVPANGYLVVFASSEDRRLLGANLHTNFKVPKSGGYLALVRPDDSFATVFGDLSSDFPEQAEDVSFGLTGTGEHKYFPTPTPGAGNGASAVNATVVPAFSPASGVFTGSVSVTLTSPVPGATIRYTTNGTLPLSTSPAYTAALTVGASTRIRAALFFPGETWAPSTTASYIRLGTDVQAFTSPLPVVVLHNFGTGAIPGVNGRGPNGDGSDVVEVAKQAQALTILDAATGNTSWSSPVVTASRAGVKLHGSSSFTFARKSYNLETWRELDERGRDLPLLGMPADNDWVLYGPDPAQFDVPLIHNSFAYELSRQSGYAAPRTRFVELFLNTTGGDVTMADHKGLYLLTEKVKRGTDRVDFEPLSADGLKGGWLLAVDRMDALPIGSAIGSLAPRHFHTAGPDRILQTADDNPRGFQGVSGGSGLAPPRDDLPNNYNSFLNFDTPGGWEITAAQRAPIQSFVRAFDTALHATNYADPALGYAPYIDVENWAHHLAIHNLTKNVDAVHLSSYLLRETPTAKLKWGPVWDFDRGYTTNGTATSTLGWANGRVYYTRLVTDLNFNQAYIDKWQDLRRGAFATANMTAIIDAQVAEITSTVAARSGLTASQWSTNIAALKTWLQSRAAAIDAQYTQPPTLLPAPGTINAGAQVTIAAPAGTIYYTLNGADPRAPGGGVAAAAIAYTGPITVNSPLAFFARARNATAWSGATRGTYFPPQNFAGLRLSEINYHPPGAGAVDGDEFEFVELRNTSAQTLNLSGLAFTGIGYSFPTGATLAPGDFSVLVRNPTQFATRYPGVPVNGTYTGKLDNAGEALTLTHALGTTLFSVTFGDAAPWPAAADGHGFTIVPVTGATDLNAAASWRASAARFGSPGIDDVETAIPRVVINELRTAGTPQPDAIELFNATANTVDLSNWWLTDNRDQPQKFAIPAGTSLPAGGYLVLTAAAFGSGPFPVTLNDGGGEVYLFSAKPDGELTGYTHGAKYGGARSGLSFGRVTNSAGVESFEPQLATTLSGVNASSRVGPVVISEIHYHPGSPTIEFVELKNLAPVPVALHDGINPWRLDGAGYDFPPGTVIEANGTLIVAASDPAAFRTAYALPVTFPVVGPFSGNLQDDGERIELQQPTIIGSAQYYATVDGVRYGAAAPWPAEANGSGASLQRLNLYAAGDEPTNWTAATPTPGLASTAGSAPDADGDGLPDAWELAANLSPLLHDALLDSDSDGFSNRDEFLAGTDPNDPTSLLNMSMPTRGLDGVVTFHFTAQPGRAYTVQSSADLVQWQIQQTVAPVPSSRTITVTDTPASPMQFYRLSAKP